MIYKFLLILFFVLLPLVAANNSEESLQDFIIHHVIDSDKWHPLPFDLFSVDFPSYQLWEEGSLLILKNGLHGTMLILSSFFLFFLFGVLYRKDSRKAPTGISNALETLVVFVRDDICINYLGKKEGRKFAPLFLNFFFFILMMNLMSLVPFFSTATANINVTAGLSTITLTFMLVLGISRNGVLGFFKIFIPSGVPVPVLIILFPIELLGLFIKPIALALRLFANMLAGHLIIFSILGLIITFGFFGIPAFFLALFVYLIEILVAFLQAYIFTMLSAMFLSEMLHPHH